MKEQKHISPIAGVLIFNKEGKVLLVFIPKFNNKYSIPGGHIEYGEKMMDAAKREVKEETGLNIYDIKFFSFREDIHPKDYYKKEHFIFFGFTAKTKATKVKLNDEGLSYVWVLPKNALKLNLASNTIYLINKYVKKHK